jgi:hypothetical protein
MQAQHTARGGGGGGRAVGSGQHRLVNKTKAGKELVAVPASGADAQGVIVRHNALAHGGWKEGQGGAGHQAQDLVLSTGVRTPLAHNNQGTLGGLQEGDGAGDRSGAAARQKRRAYRGGRMEGSTSP